MWRLCHICHTKFTKISNLKRHLRTEHLRLRFNCPQCDKQFKRKEYLRKHQARTHSQEIQDNTLSIPISFPLANFQQAVQDFDLTIFDNEMEEEGTGPLATNHCRSPDPVTWEHRQTDVPYQKIDPPNTAMQAPALSCAGISQSRRNQ